MTARGNTSLIDRIASAFLPDRPVRLGVAVSGGSDSLALMYLLRDWADQDGPVLHAVTVDHGLRPESADEAAQVAEHAARLGISHDCLIWGGWDGRGNLPDQARRARYRLLESWAVNRGISHVALGHTADDQAETFLMRLAREAGVDGLSAMAPSRRQGQVVFCRPALEVSREELRSELRNRGVRWIDDPTNEDDAYERVRARQVLAALAPLGINAASLTAVARHMSDVRKTLGWYVFQAARDLVTFQAGDILITRQEFDALPHEVARRLIQSVLKWISNAEYSARGRAIELLMAAIRDGTGMTLQGCQVIIEPDRLRVIREYQAVTESRVDIGEVWDARWRLTGDISTDDLKIGALGPEGLRQCPDWRLAGLPEASQLSGPAVWRGGELVAAPLANHGNSWVAQLIRHEEGYFASLLCS
ncbi:tRNA lysidine(34) synthetase TilS [Roseovarius aestuarii]|uniref:tRNA(Ile)-lysidine synthase n=1 Tax=Roseovarius aestuarii TaxID=475083 RepID=A0A1X7BM90_9RHOB|nr:tRNA lysidine(34) synthetase TilS [Roseovarius aestuarii]SMC10717.1 tRNA(Ile)-lysidine synthase [Roseovarius aestuarii]